MKTTKIKFIAKAAIFISLFLFMFLLIQRLVTPYWGENPNEASGESDRYLNFYNQPPNSLDYLVLGASHSYTSLNPIQIYAETGLNGYNLGNAMQAIELSYYWLMEACKTQSPRFVLLDVASLIYPDNYSGSANVSKSLVCMRPSLNKVEAAIHCKDDAQNVLEILVPLYQFHTRWDSISFSNLTRRSQNDFLNGAYISFEHKYDTQKMQINDEQVESYYLTDTGMEFTQDVVSVSSENQRYFEKILDFCQQEQIKLIPVKFPTLKWSEEKTAVIKEYLEMYSLELVVVTDLPEWENHWANDTWDNGYHTNYFGATKTSACIASYLNGLLELSDSAPLSRNINENWSAYSEWETSHLISQEMQMIQFLERLLKYKDHFIIVLSVKNDICGIWDEQLQYYFDALGLEEDFYNNYQNSYIGIIDSGITVFEKWASSPLELSLNADSDSGNSISIKVLSSGFLNGGFNSIEIDNQEYSLKNDGLNCVVINKTNGSVLSSVSIGYSGKTWTFSEIIHSAIWDSDYPENVLLEDGVYQIAPANNPDYRLTLTEVASTSPLVLQKQALSLNQSFQFVHLGGNIYTIQPTSTGEYLSVANGHTIPGADIAFSAYALAQQKWYIERNSNQSYSIYSLYNKQALDVPQGIVEPNAEIWMWSRNDESPQQFVFQCAD